MQIGTRQVLIHVFGSLIFLLLPVFFSPDFSLNFSFLHVTGFQEDFTAYTLLLGFFYLNYYWIIPELYFKKKFVLFVFILIACYAAINFLPDLIVPHHTSFHSLENEMHERGIRPHAHHRFNHPIFNAFRHYIFHFVLVLVFSILLRVREKLRKAEQEKLNTKLSLLKTQINPHFLFNTLNSIYSLALSKSDDTAIAIVKLSGLMRYVISEADPDWVSLDKELGYINDYIELQKLRLENTVRVEYSKTVHFNEEKIAPLILIPFVENAFKHGVNPEEDSRIKVTISVTNSRLELTVVNNKVSTLQDGEERSGLGIDNAQTRLQLLYPAKHKLTIVNQQNTFTVHLTLDLS